MFKRHDIGLHQAPTPNIGFSKVSIVLFIKHYLYISSLIVVVVIVIIVHIFMFMLITTTKYLYLFLYIVFMDQNSESYIQKYKKYVYRNYCKIIILLGFIDFAR